MVIIDTRTNVAHQNVTKVQAERMIGVSVSSLHRWQRRGGKAIHEHYEIYFETKTHKQKAKGNQENFRRQ